VTSWSPSNRDSYLIELEPAAVLSPMGVRLVTTEESEAIVAGGPHLIPDSIIDFPGRLLSVMALWIAIDVGSAMCRLSRS